MVNQFAGENNVLDTSVMMFSKYGPILFGLVFVWLWFSKSGDALQNQQLVLFALTVVVITIGVDKLIEFSYFRPRPFVSHEVNLLSQKSILDPSFPSNHAAGSFALAFTLFWKRKKLGSLLLILALLMALSRIFIGVHYPLDVTAGACIAFIVAAIVIWQRRLFERPYTWIVRTFSRTTVKKI